MKYYQGIYGVWVLGGDYRGCYIGNGTANGSFRIDQTNYCVTGFEEITRQRAINWLTEKGFHEGVNHINKIDPAFTPHTDIEQLEILKQRIAGKNFSRTDARGTTSPHEGPFDFTKYHYKVVTPTLEDAVKEFLKYANRPDEKWIHRDKHIANLKKAYQCYLTNKGQ